MFLVLSLLVILCLTCESRAQNFIPEPIHGVTVDNTHDVRDATFRATLLESLRRLSVKPTARIVYTPGNDQGFFSAASYLEATRQIKSVGYVMAQPVDSSYMRCFTPAEHLSRFKDYVTVLGPFVDVWEVGNEINGEWLWGSTNGCVPKASVSMTSQADVATKMTEAYDYLKSQGKVTALTLYYNTPCHRPAANEMFAWVDANIPARMKRGLDYVLVSYYELDCGGHRPDWQDLFGRIAAIFPNSRLGISEFGWSETRATDAVIKDIVSRHYAIHPGVSNWAGGGFYWEFAIDMVSYDPSQGSLWSTINTAMANQK
jgi:hypothetical protein